MTYTPHTPDIARSIAVLGLPQEMKQYVSLREGLVLVVGGAAHGKSTTLFAMLEELNRTHQDGTIITAQYRPEFTIEPKGCNVIDVYAEKDEAGRPSLAEATFKGHGMSLARMIGMDEIRDYEAMSVARDMASTGHLVFAAMHGGSLLSALRNATAWAPKEEVEWHRHRLAEALSGIVHVNRVRESPVAEWRFEFNLLTIDDVARQQMRSGAFDVDALQVKSFGKR